MSDTTPSPTDSSSSSSVLHVGGGGSIAKVLVVGNVATGKTSVINRFARNKFSRDYQTTIGVDFALKSVRAGGSELKVQLWDIAGQDRFTGLSRIFYAHAVAAIIVYDVTTRETYDAVIKWKQDIDSKVFLPSGARIPVLLLGNKCDLLEEGNGQFQPAVRSDEIEHFVRENNFYAHFICSAKTGHNIREACTHLVAKIHANNMAEMIAAQAQSDEREKEKERDGNGGSGNTGSATIKLGAGANGQPNGGAKDSTAEGGGGCC